MRVLLINTNRERRPHPVIPIGLACVAQALEGEGHQVAICDLTFAREPARAIAQAVAGSRPELIGLSIRNLDNSTYARPHSYLEEIGRLAAQCRQASGAPLVIGGAAVGIAPALCDYLQADYAVRGEGEAAALALGRALAGAPGPDLPRVLGPEECGLAAGLPALGADLARHIQTAPYLRAGAALPVQTRRGCAFDCLYCTYPALEGSRYRCKEPEQVAEEVRDLIRTTGSTAFEFVDSTFNAPLPYTLRLCEALARLPWRLHLQASGFTPACSSPELLAAMRRAGFRTLVCSPDSAADAVLAAMHKGFQREDLERLVNQVHRAGLVVLWSFLFGGPGETEETARETLRFIAERLTGDDVLLVSAGVRIYPGTPLERLAREEGLVAPGEDLLAPRFYLSPRLHPRRLALLLDEYLARASRYMFLSDLQCGLAAWLERLATRVGVPPPLWRYAPYLRRLAPYRSQALPPRDELPL